jgi:hypothetical protein
MAGQVQRVPGAQKTNALCTKQNSKQKKTRKNNSKQKARDKKARTHNT